jgi:hypothetical protein
MIQLKNNYVDLDEIWYRRYAIGDYTKIILYNFLQLVIPTWQMKKLVRLGQHQYHLLQGHTVMYDYRFLENTKCWYNNLYNAKQQHGGCMKKLI